MSPMSQAVTSITLHSPVDLDTGMGVCQSPRAAQDVDPTRLGLAPRGGSFPGVFTRLVSAPATGWGDIWVLDLEMVTG